MPVDLRLNCASEICCGPKPTTIATEAGESLLLERDPESLRSAASILRDCGVPEDLAPKVAHQLRERGIALLSVDLATAIREIAFG